MPIRPNAGRRFAGNIRAWIRRAIQALTGPLPTDWESAEIGVRSRMATGLRQYTCLIEEIDDLAFTLLTTAASRAADERLCFVQATLCVRVLQDVRVAVLAAEAGYVMQSWAVAASAYEASHTIGYLALKPERVDAWLHHQDTRNSFVKTYEAVSGCFKYLGLGSDPDERKMLADSEYRHYRYLCLAKHVNPLAERTRYSGRLGRALRTYITPVFSDRRLREAKLGLSLAARAATLSLWVIHKAHIGKEDEQLQALSDLTSMSAKLLDVWNGIDERNPGGQPG